MTAEFRKLNKVLLQHDTLWYILLQRIMNRTTLAGTVNNGQSTVVLEGSALDTTGRHAAAGTTPGSNTKCTQQQTAVLQDVRKLLVCDHVGAVVLFGGLPKLRAVAL